MAIGAGRPDILRMVLRQGMVLAIAGLGVGLLASVGVDRLLAATLPGGAAGTGRTDVVPFVTVSALVLVVTLLAAYLPARRASRINPTEALRYD
jgi:ABC-type antimicrobial peptide transport system permease subunit